MIDNRVDGRWARMMYAARMRQTGMKYREIAIKLGGLSVNRTSQIVAAGERLVRLGRVTPPSMRIDLAAIARDVRQEYHRLTGVWLK